MLSAGIARGQPSVTLSTSVASVDLSVVSSGTLLFLAYFIYERKLLMTTTEQDFDAVLTFESRNDTEMRDNASLAGNP